MHPQKSHPNYWLRGSLILLAASGTLTQLQAQTAYDQIVRPNPPHVFVLFSGSECEYTAKDVATNIASKNRWKVSKDLRERVVFLSYEQLAKAEAGGGKDAQKLQEAIDDTANTLIVVDCAKDSGTLPEQVYADIRRLNGPVSIRRSDSERILLKGEKSVLWSNLRAFSADKDQRDNARFTFVIAGDTLDAIEAAKGRLAESASEDRLPIYPDTPLDSLKDYPIAVLPLRAGAIDPQLVKSSAYISERLSSLVATLGMHQVERGAAMDAVKNEMMRQESGEVTPQDGQRLGDQLGADIVATGVIRKLEMVRVGNIVDRHWEATIEMSIKLLAVNTGEVLYDTGAIRGTSHTRANIFSNVVGAMDKSLDPSIWGNVEAEAVGAAERALKNALFMFEMGLRGKVPEVRAKLDEAYKGRGERINWRRLADRFRGTKFAVRIPETIIQRKVPDPAVETGMMRILTQSGVDVRDSAAVASSVDDLMVDNLLKGNAGPTDRRRIRKALSADVLITGEAFAVILGANGSGLNSAQARTEIKVISLKTGRILAADSREVTQAAESQEVAGKRSLEKTARLLATSSAFWNSLADNLDEDRKEVQDLTGGSNSLNGSNVPAPAPAKVNLHGMSFMVAMDNASGVPASFIRQLETAANGRLINSGATVLDPSRAEALKKLSVFRGIASGSTTDYLELKAACPADVLLIGEVESAKGASGTALQISWKAIWMADAKMIGTGTEQGLMENSDPAEEMMVSKSIANKLIEDVAPTLAANNPENRDFTIEVQGLSSVTQSLQVKKAIMGGFPNATGTYRAGTLRLTVPPRGLDRDIIAMRLEQRMALAKLKIKVVNSDLSSIRAVVTGSYTGSVPSGASAPQGPQLSDHARAIAKKLAAKGLRFAVCFGDYTAAVTGSSSAQELATAALHNAGLPIVDGRILQTRLGEDAFVDLVGGTLSSGSLDAMREKFQGYIILGGLIEQETAPGSDGMTFGRAVAVDMRNARVSGVIPNSKLDPMPSGLPPEISNKERGKRIGRVLEWLLDNLAKTYLGG